MTLAFISGIIMIFAGGLFAGAVLLVAVERVNLWRRMPVAEFAVDFRRSLYRSDPLLPILGALSGASSAIFAVTSNGKAAASLGWTAVALLLVIIGGSVVIAEPINSRFRGLPEGSVPEEAERLRTTWRRFHLARTVLALTAFFCIAAAVSAPH